MTRLARGAAVSNPGTLRGVLCLTVVVVAVACEPTSQASPRDVEVTVRDSAGVEHVTSRAPTWDIDSGWQVADSPSLSIGGHSDPNGHLIWQI